MIRKETEKIGMDLILFVLITLTSSAAYPWGERPRPLPDLYRVIRIIDGDTIVISYQGQKEIIRLLRIDTPERKQYGYRQAKEAMAGLVFGRNIRLEHEVEGKLRRDRYNRILAYIWLDNLHINVEMVRLGWSKFYTKYGAGKYIDKFKAAEREARVGKRGLWKGK